MTDEARALLIVAALLSGASGSAGFVGGRISVEAPPPEVRLIRMPPRVVRMLPAEAAPAEPVTVPPAESVPIEPAPPEALPSPPAAPVEVQPLPPPPPLKAQAKPRPPPKVPPKPEKAAAAKKPRPPAPAGKALPSCSFVKREYERMSWSEKMAEYGRATPEEVAHGKRCLGL